MSETSINVLRSDGKFIKNVIVRKLSGKRPYGRLRKRWENDIRVTDEINRPDKSVDRKRWISLVETARACVAFNAT